jgi:PAS domain S-box-containing protein
MMADQLTMPVFITTPQIAERPIRIGYSNKAFLTLLENEVFNESFNLMLGLPVDSSIDSKVKKLLLQASESEIDLLITTASGKKKWVTFRLKPLNLNDLLYFFWQQEFKVDNAITIPHFSFMEGEFHLELNNSPQIVFAFNTKGKLIYVNEKCCQLAGFNHDEFLNSGFSILLNSEDIRIAEEAFRLTLNGQHQEIRLKIHPRFGGMQYWQLDGYPFYENGQVAGTMCFANDTTNEVTEQQTNEIVLIANPSFNTLNSDSNYFQKMEIKLQQVKLYYLKIEAEKKYTSLNSPLFLSVKIEL